MRLLEALRKIESEKLHVFHMPGHKRHPKFMNLLDGILELDITEIPGADHLHDSKSCLLETRRTIEQMYNSHQSRILVNGSTVGILSMIMGCLAEGQGVLINRNAHKSVYNALEIGKLKPYFYSPQYDGELGIVTEYNTDEIFRVLASKTDIGAVVLTYPTYEGLCYDIKSIIDYCHGRDILVLVDEAHGAHFVLSESYPKSALELGADIVIHSFHKTLPAMTQTACLHFGKSMLKRPELIDSVDYYLKSLQTSSPSYPLMASIDAMLMIMTEDGKLLSKQLTERTKAMYEALSDLKTLSLYRFDVQDLTKIIIRVNPEFYKKGQWDGEVLSKRLRSQYRIQVEYETDLMLLCMSSISSSQDDFDALVKALLELDYERSKTYDANPIEVIQSDSAAIKHLYGEMLKPENQILLPHQVRRMPYELIPVEHAMNRISADYVIPYPPGIPICIPGERVTASTINLIERLSRHIMGEDGLIKVLLLDGA